MSHERASTCTGCALSERLVARDQPAFDAHSLRELRLDVALELRCRIVYHRGSTPDERRREGRPLPEVVVIGLGDGGAKALLQVRLQRVELLALALEARVVREMQVDLDEADEPYSSSRSTWRVSKTSRTSPSLTS